MYIKIENGIPIEYSVEKLRIDNPNISFPQNVSNEILKTFDVYPYTMQEKPLINEKTEKVSQGSFVLDEFGNWIKTWIVSPKTEEEIISWIAGKEMEVRYKRNKLLNDTDYLALADNTLTSEMASYRQALRDITSQEGFPENVVWPIKPL